MGEEAARRNEAKPHVPRVLRRETSHDFCYGQTGTGKTYTMNDSEPPSDVNRTQVGPSPSRGCCYEVYVRDIRRRLLNRIRKTKSLDPTGLSWWRVYELEHGSTNSNRTPREREGRGLIFAATMSNSNSSRLWSRSYSILCLEFEAESRR
ncbi:hypothetical protein F5B18DRAFT_278459 [Nemania serpens]|nr:hypothetical protein F5B18DRAFT_278459 [Nemania serpens]